MWIIIKFNKNNISMMMEDLKKKLAQISIFIFQKYNFNI